MALHVGDVIVLAYQKGSQGNTISLAPDQKICILDRKQEGAIPEHVPYVSTIRAHGKPGSDGEPTSYIVHADRVLGLRDYDTIHAADFDASTLTLGLRYPTRFRSLLRRTVQARRHEELLPPRGQEPPRLQLRLCHGNLHKSIELTREEALRRGLRFNHFARVPPPETAFAAPSTHPRPRGTPRGWQPSLHDHTAYLLADTEALLPTLRRLISELGDDFLGLARRRITEILALSCYDAIPLQGPDHVELEHALAAAARLVLQGDRALVDADASLAAARLDLLGAPGLAALAPIAGLELRRDDEAWTSSLSCYVGAAGHRRSGAWASCNRDVQDGRVALEDREVRLLLVDCVKKRRRDPPAVPLDLAQIVQVLRSHAEEMRSVLAESPDIQVPRKLVLEALPPCAAHALRKALKQRLTAPETVNAAALLGRTGLEAGKINQALTGQARSMPGLPGSTRRSKALKSPPCSVNRELGACAWKCPNTRSPLEYYAREATP